MYIDSSLVIPKQGNMRLINDLIKEYTITQFDDEGKPYIVEFFKYDDSNYYFPRYSYPCNERVKYKYDNINFKTHIIPRNNEQQRAIDYMINEESCLIKCIPGFGKTVVTIAALSKIGLKTLIVADQLSLLEQWTERFLQHSDINEDDIVRLTDKFNFDGKIILTTVQFLYSKVKRVENINDIMKESGIGVVVFDEVHTIIGPEKFTDICQVIYAKKLIGLSATPWKNDIHKKVITGWLSDKIFIQSRYDITPLVIPIRFKSKISKRKQFYFINKKNGDVIRTRYYRSLLKNTGYIDMVSNIIYRLYIKERNILALSYWNRLSEEIRDRLINVYKINENDISFFIGGCTIKELEKRIILSNYQMCYKGLDKPILDTLLFLTYVQSPTYIEQSVGRILRFHKDKNEPYVIEFIDESFNTLIDKWNVRKSMYEELGFKIK